MVEAQGINFQGVWEHQVTASPPSPLPRCAPARGEGPPRAALPGRTALAFCREKCGGRC